MGYASIFNYIYTCCFQQAEIKAWNQIVAFLGLGLLFSLSIDSGEIVNWTYPGYFHDQFKPFSLQIQARIKHNSGYFCFLMSTNSGGNTRESGGNTRDQARIGEEMFSEHFTEQKYDMKFGPKWSNISEHPWSWAKL